MKSPIPWKLVAIFALPVFGLVFALSLWLLILRPLPNLEGENFQDIKNRALALLGQIPGNQAKNFDWISIDQISEEYLYAIVMGEDASFFQHSGLHYDSIREAVRENIKKRKYARGGSTISQQVVKNVFLSREKTLIRKIKEAIITSKIEQVLSKKQILELYINIAPFGPGIYGVKNASLHFFDILPNQVNAAQGAFITLMLPSPQKNYERIFKNENINSYQREKIDRILNEMRVQGWINEEQFEFYRHYRFFDTEENFLENELVEGSQGPNLQNEADEGSASEPLPRGTELEHSI